MFNPMRPFIDYSKLAWTLLLAIGLAAPWFFYDIVLMNILCLALFAYAFDLLVGYVGLLSFGQAAFFGGAAYVTAYCAKMWDFPPLAAIACGAVFAALIGLAFGIVAIRRHGIYFAMITFALQQMIFYIAVQLPQTGGDDGIQTVPRGTFAGVDLTNTPNAMYYLVLAIFTVSLITIRRVVHSPFGHILSAIRENETRAISLGYKVKRYKLLAFVISATLTGIAGSTKVLVLQLASQNDIHWLTSGSVILMVLLGGVGTSIGPLVGATILVAIDSYFGRGGSYVTIVQGSVFVFCVLTFRKGIVGELEDYWQRRVRQKISGASPS